MSKFVKFKVRVSFCLNIDEYSPYILPFYGKFQVQRILKDMFQKLTTRRSTASIWFAVYPIGQRRMKEVRLAGVGSGWAQQSLTEDAVFRSKGISGCRLRTSWFGNQRVAGYQ